MQAIDYQPLGIESPRTKGGLTASLIPPTKLFTTEWDKQSREKEPLTDKRFYLLPG